MFNAVIDLVKWANKQEKGSLNMKCVKCGSEMEAGYIQCRDGVFWSKKKRMVAAVCFSKDAIHLVDEFYGPLAGEAVTAHKCENCRQIVIEY